MNIKQLVPNLWFDGDAEEAAAFYVLVFDGTLGPKTYYPEGSPGVAGTVMTASWEVLGTRFVGINGGPQFSFSEAVSFEVPCEDQAEIDRVWDALIAGGGQEGPCGWCKDRFGLSWQVVPAGMEDLFAGEDPSRAQRAFAAMSSMKKLDIAALREAADGIAA